MKNIISTWICLDNERDATYFPSAKGRSSDIAVQNIYWRCVCCFFTTARYFNPQAHLVLFTNVEQLPEVEGTSVQALMSELGVHVEVTPFEFRTPEGYWNQWRNQFYEFSIFRYLSTHPGYCDDDRILLLDSDCIITRDLSRLFRSIEESGCITYHIDYQPDHVVNGCSRLDMQKIFSELLKADVWEVPVYHGGEIYASTIGVMKRLAEDFVTVWKNLLDRHVQGLPKLNEEAHVLSFLFYKNNIKGGQANRFIKRLWTDPASFRNVVPADQWLAIWHLPAEKRTGFPAYFRFLQHIEFKAFLVDSDMLLRRLQKTFLVPRIPMHRQPYYLGKALMKKILTRQ